MKTLDEWISIFVIILLLFTLIWGIYITKLQLEFTEDCKNKTSSLGLDYRTKFFSYPINNVNGKCWYVNKTIVDMTPEQIKENKSK